MKDKKTDKELKNNYPEPGVPANEAWAGMNTLLDSGIQDTPQSKGSKVTGGKIFPWQYSLLIVVVNVSILVYYKTHKSAKTFPANKVNKIENNNTAVLYDTIKVSDQKLINKAKSGTVVIATDTVSKNQKGNFPVLYDTVKGLNNALLNKAKAADIMIAHEPVSKNQRNNTSSGNDIGKVLHNQAEPGNIFITHEPVSKKEKNNLTSISSRQNNLTKDISIDIRGNEPNLDPPKKKNNTGKTIKENATFKNTNKLKKDELNIDNPGKQNEDGNNETTSLNTRNKKIKHRYTNSKRNLSAQNNLVAGNRENLSGELTNNIHLQAKSYQQIETGNTITPLPSDTRSFLEKAILNSAINSVQPDSSYIKNINDSVKKSALLKKNNSRSKNKKSNNNKTGADVTYGFQWDVPIPIQGVKNYFKSTDTHSRPYNLLLPGIWLSKGSKAGKVLFGININQQYFTGNKEVRSYTSIMSAPDTGTVIHKTSLSKINGVVLKIEYTHKISNWSAGIGISYNINKKALLYNNDINVTSGRISGDSLYSINNSSTDWQYVYRSKIYTDIAFYYTHNKISLGVAAVLPLGSIITLGKNIHPVNANVFIRWNIK